MDFEHIPFFDNHTHRINVTTRSIQPLELAVAFMHGWGTVNDPGKPLGNSAEVENCTPDYAEHVMNMGVFKALVHQLSKYFGCEATPEAVTAERNIPLNVTWNRLNGERAELSGVNDGSMGIFLSSAIEPFQKESKSSSRSKGGRCRKKRSKSPVTGMARCPVS